MWQGLQEITEYKKNTSHVTDTDVTLPDKLSTFFAHFEDNIVPPSRPANKDCAPHPSFSVAEVSKTFKRVNFRKAAGRDGIPSRVLRACTDQLAAVFTDLFKLSLSAVPTCFKMATIVPEHKKSKVTELNDYCQ